MLPSLSLIQIELRAPCDDTMPMVDEVLQNLLEVHHLGRTVDQRQHYRSKRGLHLSVLVELIHHDFRICVALQLDHHTHAIAIRLVTQVGDVGDLLSPHELRYLFNESRFIDLERDLSNDNLRLAG